MVPFYFELPGITIFADDFLSQPVATEYVGKDLLSVFTSLAVVGLQTDQKARAIAQYRQRKTSFRSRIGQRKVSLAIYLLVQIRAS